ncbi:MAG: diguanylate cyclase [Magnetococcales bacterium]|nr:diguanylate cyclase [Magnetococcales bacterium]
MKIGHRILALVGTVVFISMVWITNHHIRWQEENILAQNERDVLLLTESIQQSLMVIMVAGDAEYAKSYTEYLRGMKDILDFQILRTDGKEAFLNNDTIDIVNGHIGQKEFPKKEEASNNNGVTIVQPDLLKVIEKGSHISKYGTTQNTKEKTLTILAPIKSEQTCYRCHGDKDKFRGIIKITTSLALAKADIAQSKHDGYLMLFLALILVGSTLIFLINITVAKPITKITKAMAKIASGDYKQLLLVEGTGELPAMARSFNTMGVELFKTHQQLKNESDKLTTIILSAKEGIIVTNNSGEIVLVNPSAERLLGKRSEAITDAGFLEILEDPEYISALCDPANDDVPPTVVYNNRILHINAATIKTNDDIVIGSSALIRDVTQEKNLENKLRTLSITDGLTKLYNRRWFDESIDDEFRRARRYKLNLGLLFFDVDHFKRFNDDHGHDQGDRVLQAIGEVMQEHFRDVDFCFRYGGEEFCAILPSTGNPGCGLAAERLRQKIEAMEVDGLKITISIGVAMYPDVGTSATDMVKKADIALYEAKKNGRNQVCFALPDNDPPLT